MPDASRHLPEQRADRLGPPIDTGRRRSDGHGTSIDARQRATSLDTLGADRRRRAAGSRALSSGASHMPQPADPSLVLLPGGPGPDPDESDGVWDGFDAKSYLQA